MALCLFIVSECRGLLHSGSPSGSREGAPKPPPAPKPSPPTPSPCLSAEVKMDEMATLMNAWSDRWMNGVTWWLDNRNCPQDWRSKRQRGPTIEYGAGLLKGIKVMSASG